MVREYGTGYVSDVKACGAWVKVEQQFNQCLLPPHVLITPASIIGSSFEEGGIVYDMTTQVYFRDRVEFVAENAKFGDRRGGWKIVEFSVVDTNDRPSPPLELVGLVLEATGKPNPCAVVKAAPANGGRDFLVHVNVGAFSHVSAAQSVRDGHLDEFLSQVVKGATVQVKAIPANHSDSKGLCKNAACKKLDFKLDAISLVMKESSEVIPSVEKVSTEVQTSPNDEFTRLCDALLDCSMMLTREDFSKVEAEAPEVWDYLMAYEAEKVEEARRRSGAPSTSA